MAALTAILFVLAIGYSAGADYRTRIIGGENAPDGIAPWQASLRFMFYQHNCGASVIDKYWVLTAAHCMDNIYGQNLDYLTIVVGTNTLGNTGDRYTLVKSIIHENYDRRTYANDICLLKTGTEIKYTAKVQPIPLADRTTEPGASLLLTGWGIKGTDGEMPNDLQMLNLTAISTESCSQRYEDYYKRRGRPNAITENVLCADAGTGKGGCQGDSGGPVVDGNMLAGVVSVGVTPCGQLGVPDVMTRVEKYRSWISNTMSSN
ncbi:unnamed protein product [Leptosia nina]|uniref:trypsin n=1 Tax=Leptosia nina TaxID=320188 RepID=A0AAV1JFR9_9NEOP